ncbi:MAG: glycosyltransferase family 4 protein [Bacteroidales bacterium]|jgi:glycosyltransferase involved in cell wall biosynthesis|nr:glycosyltransferase family 4 protein [Bacteroidales bacterium]
MKVLFVCNKSPFPPKEGGAMVMYAALMGLLEAGHTVKVLTFSSNKFPTKDIPDIISDDVETVNINLTITPWMAFKNLFSRKSLHIVRFINKEMEQKLIRQLTSEHFDIVQLESLYMTPYIDTIRKHSTAAIILRAHNIEYRIWKRIAGNSKFFLKRLYINLLAERLKRYEISVLNKIDGVATLSQVDLDFYRRMGGSVPMKSIPFSINTGEFPYDDFGIPEFPSFYHIGSMDWMPNQEGIQWFLKTAWPAIHKKNTNAVFYLAGRNMPDWLLKDGISGVTVIGEVEDSQQFMRSKCILTVPLLSGSGIRIKIIEGMACVRPILTTTIGAEGIDYTDGDNIMIADTPEEFIDKAQKLIDNYELCKEMGESAHALISEKYDTKKIIVELLNFYNFVSKNRE